MVEVHHTGNGVAISGDAGRKMDKISLLARDAVDDIANKVLSTAKEFAPLGPTGNLKKAGIERSAVGRQAITNIAAFGGGQVVRGDAGRFVGAATGNVGHIRWSASVYLSSKVPHSVWVHEGTGIYGPRKRPIRPVSAPYMVFFYVGKKWMLKSVRGQRPQPFLTRASQAVEEGYARIRINELRAMIKTIS